MASCRLPESALVHGLVTVAACMAILLMRRPCLGYYDVGYWLLVVPYY